MRHIRAVVLVEVAGLECTSDVVGVLSGAQGIEEQYGWKVEVHGRRVADVTRSDWIRNKGREGCRL
jgi:hypothetical protein